jgi:1-acyl-sn-glycerol-3-phosphate acyltransferase
MLARAVLPGIIGSLIIGTAKALTGAQAQWIGCGPYATQRIYYANHSSHLDFILLWSALPYSLRRRTRPVAAADYWFDGGFKEYLIRRVFNGVAVERQARTPGTNPLQPMLDALDEGASLIIFPEGTRGSGEELLPFKSGIYHLAKDRRNIELVPVWMENCYRVMPKGSFLPVPLLCSVRFGEPTHLAEEERKPAFLDRLKTALEGLRSQ